MTKSFSLKEDVKQKDCLQENLTKDEGAFSEAVSEKQIELISLANEKVSDTSLNDLRNSVEYLTKTSDIANRIEAELEKFWTSKRKIRSYIREINKRTVYNFVKNMITITNSSTVLSDIRKYITYYELKHIVYSFLCMVDAMKLSDNLRYKHLYKEYENIVKVCRSNPNKGINKKTAELLNLRISNLFELLCRHIR